MKLATALILISICDNKTCRWCMSATHYHQLLAFFFTAVRYNPNNPMPPHECQPMTCQARRTLTMMNLVQRWPDLTGLCHLQHPRTLTGHKITTAYSPTSLILNLTTRLPLPALIICQCCHPPRLQNRNAGPSPHHPALLPLTILPWQTPTTNNDERQPQQLSTPWWMPTPMTRNTHTNDDKCQCQQQQPLTTTGANNDTDDDQCQ